MPKKTNAKNQIESLMWHRVHSRTQWCSFVAHAAVSRPSHYYMRFVLCVDVLCFGSFKCNQTAQILLVYDSLNISVAACIYFDLFRCLFLPPFMKLKICYFVAVAHHSAAHNVSQCWQRGKWKTISKKWKLLDFVHFSWINLNVNFFGVWCCRCGFSLPYSLQNGQFDSIALNQLKGIRIHLDFNLYFFFASDELRIQILF